MNEVAAGELVGRGWLKKLLWPLLLALVAYAALLLYGDAGAVLASLPRISGSAVAICLGLAAANYLVRFARWHFYLARIGIAVPFGSSLLIFLSGLGMSITPGKLGEMLKSVLLKESFEIPLSRSMPIVLAERATDLLALLVIGLVGLSWSARPALALGLASILVVLFFLAGRSRRLGRLLVSAAGYLPVVKRHRSKVESTQAALYELWHPLTFGAGFVLALVAWQLQAVVIVVLARSLGDAPVSLLKAGLAYTAPLLAGSLALLPGGLGITEASMAGMLRALSGVSPAGAATLTIMVRLTTFWFAIGLGFGALSCWGLRHAPTSSRPAWPRPGSGR